MPKKPTAATTDEKGNRYTTAVVEHVPCQWCGTLLPQRAEGRARRFCGPTCRQRHRRSAVLF